MQKTQSMQRRKQKAFTLTELAIVLGAMGLVMGVLWTIISTIWDGYRFNKMNEQVMLIVQNVREHFGPKGCIAFGGTCAPAPADGDITANLDDDNFRLIPVTMRTVPTVSGGPINHDLAVTAAGSLSVTRFNGGRTFRIAMDNLSQGNCIKLLVQFPVTMPELGVIRLEANATVIAFDPRNPTLLPATIPVSPAAAAGYCNQAGNTNMVDYDFRLFP